VASGIGEFFVSLTVDAAEGALTVSNLVSSFGQLEVATVAEIGVLWELGVRLAAVVDEGIKASLGLEQFTMHTGLSAQALQKWQIVAQQSHASAEDVTTSVEALTKHLANLAIGIPDGALAGLQQLGISIFDASGHAKNSLQIFDEVRRRLGAVTSDAGQQERILSTLGISPNLREMFLLSDRAYSRRAALVPGMSADQEKRLDELRQTFVEIELKAKQIGIDLAAGLAPILTSWIGWMKDIVREFEALYRNPLVQGLVRPALDIGKASLSTWGDLLNVFAGRGLDVADITRQRDILSGAGLRLLGNFYTLPPDPRVAEAARSVHIDKHDTIHIHDAHNPEKIAEVLGNRFEESLGVKVLDGFDQQHNNGGY
jgi:hypothetical protein